HRDQEDSDSRTAGLEVFASDNPAAPERQPRISLHSGGRVASQIGLFRSAPIGEVSIINNPGTGYERFGALLVTAYGGGQAMELKPGTADHTYMAFFPRTSSPTTRGGFVGFGSSGTTQLTIQNEISGGDINLVTAGGGQLRRNGNRVWDEGNDGAGSGTDADLLDGIQSSGFVRKANDVIDAIIAPGTLNVSANSSASLTQVATGAAAGDHIVVACTFVPPTGIVYFGEVTSANNIRVRFYNVTGALQSFDPGTVNFRVIKRSW
ncbi:MAG: hypothetical protein HC933_14255, partial [Pleurocapsa sp. SU_196_0]|nr:hypothetical protein [Pleurocapsa sp. SU_196_0]